jgi:hypothetical protein
MKNLNLVYYLPIFLFLFTLSLKAQLISHNNKKIHYTGRIAQKDSCAEIYWTGSSITLQVKNTTTVKALLQDDGGNNYYYVIIDDSIAQKINITTQKQWYTLATNISTQKHTIQLYKLTNTDYYTTRFYGIDIDASGKLLHYKKKYKHSIEFFGNSITAGHGVEVAKDSADKGQPYFFNNYLAYGAITARHFNAQYHCTAKSGIGVTISWFKDIMPEIYDRLNPADSNSKWNFTKFQPEIIVINLFQNDSWLVNNTQHPQYKLRFDSVKPTNEFLINAYYNFLQNIRSKYPKANIICCLGNMDATKEGSKWPSLIKEAVSKCNDKKITTLFFPYKNSSAHPNVKEQEAMANQLIAFIKNNYWK